MKLIPLSDAAGWEAAISKFPQAPAHTHAYNAALQLSFSDPLFLFAHEKGACPLLLRQWEGTTDIATPYGYGGMIGSAAPGWEDFARKQGWVCGYLALHPTLSPVLPGTTPGHTFYLVDLLQEEEALLNSMEKTHRYEIRRDAGKYTTIPDKKLIKQFLYSLYKQTLARVGAAPVYHFSEETLHALLDLPGSVALSVHEEAVILCLSTPHMADYFLSAATEEGRKYTRVLLWQAMLELKKRGVKSFNLGGGAKPGDALEAFKRRFGGQARPIPVLKQVYDETAFARLCQQAGTAAGTDGYFPPYRRSRP